MVVKFINRRFRSGWLTLRTGKGQRQGISRTRGKTPLPPVSDREDTKMTEHYSLLSEDEILDECA
ncbi:hypothetical protein ACC753_37620, partial [Rhizobium ruizarguesonis]